MNATERCRRLLEEALSQLGTRVPDTRSARPVRGAAHRVGMSWLIFGADILAKEDGAPNRPGQSDIDGLDDGAARDVNLEASA